MNHLIGEGFLDFPEEWLKAWYCYDLKWSTKAPKHVTVPRDNLAELVTEAKLKSDVFDLVSFIVKSKHEAGVELAGPLFEFFKDIESGVSRRPPGLVGRKKNWGRDFIIINAMEFVMFGDPDDYKTWRRPLANREKGDVRKSFASASEILELALPHTRIGGMKRRTVEAIWEKSQKREDHSEARSLYLVGMLDDLDDLNRV
ncbi:hypothetical protein [Jannaschia seohaensis]|nr:hypothetical protein [Jannaschia seohaensis]